VKQLILLAILVVSLSSACGASASASTGMKPLMSVKVEGLVGKTLGEVYPSIDPAGKIKTYSIYCVSEKMSLESTHGYVEYRKMFYPGYFYGIGTLVSRDTRCSLNVAGLRKQFVSEPRLYREIASGMPEFPDLIIGEQVRGFSKTNPNLVCRANRIGVFGVGYAELYYSKAIIRPFGVYMVYSSRDLQCTTSPKVVSLWISKGWVEIPPPPENL
jgi:hypothetical protein